VLRALGVGDVRLELHDVRASRRNRVDEGVGQSKAAVVRLADLSDD
jgi:hypothetical protein